MSKLYNTPINNVNNIYTNKSKKVNKKFIYSHDTYAENRIKYSYDLRYKVTKKTYEVFRYLSDVMRHDDNAPIGAKKVKYSTIATKSGCSISTVRRAIKTLTELGVLVVEEQKGNKGQDVCNMYQLVPFSIYSKTVGEEKEKAAKKENEQAKKNMPNEEKLEPETSEDAELYNQPKSLPKSFLNKLYTKSYIKDESAPHVIIDNIANIVFPDESSKQNKQARKYLQQMYNMAMFLTDSVLDTHDFLNTLRHTFIQLHKPHFAHIKNRYGYLASCIIDTLEQTYARGFGFKAKEWFDTLKAKKRNKKQSQGNPAPLTPAFIRKPLVFD